MAEYLIQGSTLDAIADAINAKTGGSSAMTPAEMVTAIGSISGGGGSLDGLVMHTGEVTVLSPVTDVTITHGFSTTPLIIAVYPKNPVVHNSSNNIIGGIFVAPSTNALYGVKTLPINTSITLQTNHISRYGWYTNSNNPNGAQETNSSGAYIKSPNNTDFLFGGGGTYPVLNTTYVWKAYAFESGGV